MNTKLPNWTAGIESTLKRNGAFLPDQYSWHAIDEKGHFIFITEADHKDKNSAIINLKEGYIIRNIDPAQEDWHVNTKRHSDEVLSAIKLAYKDNLPVKVLLTRYSKYSKEPKTPIKAMLLPWEYHVSELNGDTISEGYSFRLDKHL